MGMAAALASLAPPATPAPHASVCGGDAADVVGALLAFPTLTQEDV